MDTQSQQDTKKTTGLGVVDFETWFNVLLQRLFPVWYCVRYVSEMTMESIGDINPKSFLSHRWLSVPSVCKAAADSLEHAGPNWTSCAQLLRKLPRSRTYKRYLSVRYLMAVESSTVDENYPSLIDYAEDHSKDVPNSSAEHFDQLVSAAFPDSNKHYPVCYREWDGRYYLKNEGEPKHLGALLMHCRERSRDINVKVEIDIDYIDQRVLEIIRSRYWLLLMKRDAAYQVAYLIRSAKIPCQLAEFEWRRSDLVFMVLKKSHYRTAQIVEAMVRKHFPHSVIEWGRYLSSHNYPFRNR